MGAGRSPFLEAFARLPGKWEVKLGSGMRSAGSKGRPCSVRLRPMTMDATRDGSDCPREAAGKRSAETASGVPRARFCERL